MPSDLRRQGSVRQQVWTMIRDTFASASKVERAFVKQNGSLVSILFAAKDRELRNRLFDLETEITDASPEASFDFQIVSLWSEVERGSSAGSRGIADE